MRNINNEYVQNATMVMKVEGDNEQVHSEYVCVADHHDGQSSAMAGKTYCKIYEHGVDFGMSFSIHTGEEQGEAISRVRQSVIGQSILSNSEMLKITQHNSLQQRLQ